MKDGGESDQGQRANTKPENLLNLAMTADEHRSPLSKTSSKKEPGELRAQSLYACSVTS